MKKNLSKNVLFLLILVFVIMLPFVSFGQNPGTNPPANTNPPGTNPPPSNSNTTSVTIESPIGPKTVDGFIKVVLEGVIKIGIPIIALAIIYSGFLFVAARGAPEKLKKAKDALLYTLIGAAILLGSWAIAQIISNTVLAL